MGLCEQCQRPIVKDQDSRHHKCLPIKVINKEDAMENNNNNNNSFEEVAMENNNNNNNSFEEVEKKAAQNEYIRNRDQKRELLRAEAEAMGASFTHTGCRSCGGCENQVKHDGVTRILYNYDEEDAFNFYKQHLTYNHEPCRSCHDRYMWGPNILKYNDDVADTEDKGCPNCRTLSSAWLIYSDSENFYVICDCQYCYFRYAVNSSGSSYTGVIPEKHQNGLGEYHNYTMDYSFDKISNGLGRHLCDFCSDISRQCVVKLAVHSVHYTARDGTPYGAVCCEDCKTYVQPIYERRIRSHPIQCRR